MNLVVEIIDGVAYARQTGDCSDCVIYNSPRLKCKKPHEIGYCYRHLTAEERVAVQEALGRGSELKTEYTIQLKWRGSRRWETSWMHYTSMNEAKLYLRCHNENAKRYKSRIIKRAVGKWEVVE